MSINDIYNYLRINGNITTSGQPTEAQFWAAAAEGVQVVINLATLESDTTLEDEAELVRTLGMDYYHIPVVWDNPTEGDFKKFKNVMQRTDGKVIHIHCVANYRVTVFYSLYAMETMGWSKAQADALMALIWEGGPYPIWDAFVKRIRENL